MELNELLELAGDTGQPLDRRRMSLAVLHASLLLLEPSQLNQYYYIAQEIRSQLQTTFTFLS